MICVIPVRGGDFAACGLRQGADLRLKLFERLQRSLEKQVLTQLSFALDPASPLKMLDPKLLYYAVEMATSGHIGSA